MLVIPEKEPVVYIAARSHLFQVPEPRYWGGSMGLLRLMNATNQSRTGLLSANAALIGLEVIQSQEAT